MRSIDFIPVPVVASTALGCATSAETYWQGRVSGLPVDPVRNREDLRRDAWRALAEPPPPG